MKKSKQILKDKDLFNFVNKQPNTVIEAIDRKSAFKEALSDFMKNKVAMFGLIFFIGLLVTAGAIVMTSTHEIIIGNPDNILQAPSWDHLFGTDDLGRDLWTRTWYGVLESAKIASVATIFNMGLATLVGVTTGYFDGADKFFKPIIKVLYALPSILILILFSVVFGPSFWVIILSLVVTGWVAPSQQVRAQTLRMRNQDFITASQTLGTGAIKILGVFFVLAIPTIIIQTSMIFPRAILNEATLGFLGLSVPDVPTLGSLINSGRAHILLYPSKVFIPIGFLVGLVGSIQFVGFGIESAFGSSRTGR